MRYDEIRYEEPFAGPGYDEPLDDDAWVAELRRSAPAYPQKKKNVGKSESTSCGHH